MKAKRVTIKDVAERAQVSKTAVSFAFNDPSRLSDSTLNQILAAAEDLGYTRNPSARALATRHTNSLAVLLPQPIERAMENPYYTQLFRGIGQTCGMEGLTMLLVPPLYGSMRKAIPYAAVDGFIVCGLENDSGEIQTLRSSGLPFVLLDGEDADDVSRISVDEQEGMRQLTEYVLEQGHRHLLVLAFRSGTDAGPTAWRGVLARRIAGVSEALHGVGLSLDSPHIQIREVPSTRKAGYDAFRQVWESPDHPTAVLAFSDILALGVLDAAHKLGIDVPGDVSVTGFDDLNEAETARPALTTVRQPIVSKGRLAAEYLVEAVNVEDPLPHRRKLHTTLVLRDSVSRPRPVS
ncbi:MAG: LacI family transcriptional regulator [Propionibacteriaceae bacterium]|jgi:DNA-binding LacI/PurR family transcriptional regulator|nr:LacI family transcriptional regulator [Propionibacteriaceae bacterium]